MKFSATLYQDLLREKSVIKLSGEVNAAMSVSLEKQIQTVLEQKEGSKKRLVGSPKRVAVVINTNGGNVIDGFALWNQLNALRNSGDVGQMWIVGQGQVVSMGVFLLTAQPDPQFRIVCPGTVTYHHRTSACPQKTTPGGDDERDYQHRESGAFLAMTKHRELVVLEVMQRAFRTEQEKLIQLREHPCYLSPEEAVAFGFYGSIATEFGS